MRNVVGPIGLVLISLGGLSCEAPADTMDFIRDPLPIWRAKELTPAAENPTQLKVMAWNVKYGAGRIDFWFDFWGDRVQMTVDEVGTNMEAIYKLINEYDPDVMLNSEIEAGSRRSAYYDMIQGVLDHTKLNYGVYGLSWDSRYIANEGLGRLSLGNAIFSKYPITFGERIRQDDRTDQAPHVKYFYIHRAICRAVIDLGGGREVAAYSVHTEAYDTDGTKQRHISQIFDEVKKETRPFIVGGDFNELPPICDERVANDCDGKLQLADFDDERAVAKGTDYAQPPYTPHVMKPFFDELAPSVTLEMYGATRESQRRYFSHTTLGPDTPTDADPSVKGFWNRTLDYLFVRKSDGWVADSTGVLQKPGDQGIASDPMRLSDHAPTVGTWRLP
jgi:endonuclease/exonuclease/phosphatase family metal-dependent hydrolase